MREKINDFIENIGFDKLAGINWKLFFDWAYLTDPRPSQEFFYEQWVYFIVLINMMLAFITFRFIGRSQKVAKPKSKIITSLSFLWFGNSVFLLLYDLVRVEGVTLLSMRIFLLVIFIGYIGILIYGIVFWIIFLPRRIENYKEARIRDKFIHKKKK